MSSERLEAAVLDDGGPTGGGALSELQGTRACAARRRDSVQPVLLSVGGQAVQVLFRYFQEAFAFLRK